MSLRWLIVMTGHRLGKWGLNSGRDREFVFTTSKLALGPT